MLKSTCALLGITVLIAVVFCGVSQPVAPSHPYLLADGPEPPAPPIPIPWLRPDHSVRVADGPEPPAPPIPIPWLRPDRSAA
jgi:hypothetical protein